jgi:5-methylcytosine-specific restriction enzyme subunit McrC
LFEAFLVNFVRRHRLAILPPELQDCDLLPQARGECRWLAQTYGKPVFRLKPDLAIRDDRKFPLLVDAKYKRLKPDVPAAGIAQDDFNQMFAYAHRYDCPRVLMFHPQTADMPNDGRWEFTLEGTNGKTVVAATVNVRNLGSKEGQIQLVERLRQVFQDKRVLP